MWESRSADWFRSLYCNSIFTEVQDQPTVARFEFHIDNGFQTHTVRFSAICKRKSALGIEKVFQAWFDSRLGGNGQL